MSDPDLSESRHGEITTEVEIDASPAVVWEVLTDFESYSEWDPGLEIDGETDEGGQLAVTFAYPNQRPTTVHRWSSSETTPPNSSDREDCTTGTIGSSYPHSTTDAGRRSSRRRRSGGCWSVSSTVGSGAA